MSDTPPRRQTRQRTAVTDVLGDASGFLSAQEIHDVLRQRGDRVGLTTVYRALQAMSDDGLVDVIVRDDGESVYRSCSEHHHHHLVCRRCRATIELEAPAVEAWAEDVAARHGFADVAHTVEVFGVCPDCAGQGPLYS
ncbi:MAG: Fur family transcriptional regulator [Candidatus Nanopelagicales bacterium]|jgi:Fur family ferric uptake transcriptional regulator